MVITMVSWNLIHTVASKEACAAGVKFAPILGPTKEYLARLDLSKNDLFEVRALTEEIARRLTMASTAHLTTRAGTDLHMYLKRRKELPMVPFGVKGSIGGSPDCAEATCPPIEDSGEGVVVVDGSMIGEPNFDGIVEKHQGLKAQSL